MILTCGGERGKNARKNDLDQNPKYYRPRRCYSLPFNRKNRQEYQRLAITKANPNMIIEGCKGYLNTNSMPINVEPLNPLHMIITINPY